MSRALAVLQLLLSEALNIYFTTRTELRNCGIVTLRCLGVIVASGHRDLLVRKAQADGFSRRVMAWASRKKYSHLYLPLAGVVDYVPNTTRLVTKALAASNVILKLMVTTAGNLEDDSSAVRQVKLLVHTSSPAKILIGDQSDIGFCSIARRTSYSRGGKAYHDHRKDSGDIYWSVCKCLRFV